MACVRRNTQHTRPALPPAGDEIKRTPIPGWEGKYAIDDMGRVWSLPRIGPSFRRATPLLLKTARGGRRKNYLRVHLTDRTRGLDYFAYVHHLAALAFFGPRPDGMQILHGPGGSLDNSRENLRYGTAEENAEDEAVRRWCEAHPDAEPAPF